MGIAKLYSQSGGNGLKINGIIEDYYAYAGENISAGDFVEFVKGIASGTIETSVDTAIGEETYAGYNVISVCKLSENKVFIAHGNDSGNSKLYGIVCVIDGATITCGTDTLLSSTSYSGYHISTVALSDNKVFIAHSQGSDYYLYGMVCTISDTEITVVVDKTIVGVKYTGLAISTELLPDGNVFIAYDFGNYHYLHGTVCTISETTVTIGTDTTLNGNNNGAGKVISTSLLENGNVFIAHSRSDYLYGMVCTISGTTIAAGTDTQLSSTTYTGRAISLDKITPNKVFISHENDSDLYGMVCSISYTSISAGTDTHIFNYTTTTDSSTLTLATDRVLVIGINNTTDYKMFGVICDISGTTITLNTPKIMNSDSYTGWQTTPVLLGETIFVAHSHTQNKYYLYAQMFGVVDNQPSAQVTIAEYETQVRKATTSDIYGVAKTSGRGGDSAGHNDKVRIYTI